jgi:hypothetical protein
MKNHQYQRLLLIFSRRDLYTITASVLSTIYEDNIEREEVLDLWTSLSSRLQLLQKLEQWRHALDQSLLLIDPSEPGHTLETTKASFRFRLSLSIHYYRTLMLIDGPILTILLDLVVHDKLTEQWGFLFDQCIPLVGQELLILRNTHHVLSLVLRKGESFINVNNIWWACSHTGMTRQ